MSHSPTYSRGGANDIRVEVGESVCYTVSWGKEESERSIPDGGRSIVNQIHSQCYLAAQSIHSIIRATNISITLKKQRSTESVVRTIRKQKVKVKRVFLVKPMVKLIRVEPRKYMQQTFVW